MKRAIIVLSVGERPWFRLVRQMLSDYASRCLADFYVESELPSKEEFDFPDLPDRPGRKNKIAYASKAFLPWKYLALGYDQVLMLDDTCCIGKEADNVFECVRPGYTGLAPTGLEHALDSFMVIEGEKKAKRLPPVKRYTTERYGNTGVVVYDKSCIDAIKPEKIIKAQSLLFAKRPHQTLFYYLMERERVNIQLFHPKYNHVPGTGIGMSLEARRALKSVEEIFDENIQIYHVTGLSLHRNELIQSIANKYGYF